ncbi:MAG: cytochrome c [Burkholderiales bacterium]|nr:cytochrome c [Burkholderiales bacterium]
MARHTFALAVALWFAVLGALAFAIRPPIPASVLTIYMALVTLGIGVYVAANEERWRAFLAPICAVLDGRAPRPIRWAVLFASPMLVGWGAWWWTAPSWDAPYEPRVVHPEPPASFVSHGRRVEVAGLVNPLRTADTATLAQRVAEGREIYYRNCFYCHGDALAGDGHFAGAFSPLPANFRDVGTIAMLQESYVYWRIATGGPGLPKGGAPWQSAMPVWQSMLSEDEIWKVVLYIYEGSNSTPRTWDDGAGHAKH